MEEKLLQAIVEMKEDEALALAKEALDSGADPLEMVASGILRTGDRLPSESQICKRYDVSPMTVRRAINILADQGVVDTAQGKGTFVKPIRLEAAVFQLKALQDIFCDEETSVTILEVSIFFADQRVSQKLNLDDKERVIYIRRLISRKEMPLIYHREYLIYDPRRALVESELEVTSLRGLFRGEVSSDFKFGDLSIEATVINGEEANVLKVPTGSAAFNLEHIFFDYSDQPVSWGWFICRGVQIALYRSGDASTLAWANTLLGWPVVIAVLIVTYIYGLWRLSKLGGPGVDEFREGKSPPWQGQKRGF